MRKMRTTFPSKKILTRLLLFVLSSSAYGMRIERPFSPLLKTPIELSLRKVTLTTDQQQITVNTNILAPCQALTTLINSGVDTLPLPNIPPYQLIHFAACLQAHYNLVHATTKEEHAKARTQFDAQLNTEERVCSTLLSANYVGHDDLRAMCTRICVTKKYAQAIAQKLPLELEVEVGQSILDTTPIFSDIPYWTAQDTWLKPVRTLTYERAAIWSIASDTAGSFIATGDALGVVHVYNQDQATPCITFQAHESPISTVSFNDDATKIVTCASDGSIKFWDITSNTPCGGLEIDHPFAPFVVKNHTKTEQTAYEEQNEIILMNLKKEEELILSEHVASVVCLAFNHDGSLLASGSCDSTVKIWNTANGNCNVTLSPHLTQVTCVEFSPDGALFASGSKDGKLYLYDASTFEVMTNLLGHKGKIWSLIFSKDNTYLYSASTDGSIKIWHIPSACLIKNLVPPKRSSIFSMTLQPQGTLVTAARNGQIVFWDIQKIIAPIQSLQKHLQRNTTIDQAQLILEAYDAPHREPLDCSLTSDPRDEHGKRERGDTFQTLAPEMQKLLIKRLRVKPPERKLESSKETRKKKTTKKNKK